MNYEVKELTLNNETIRYLEYSFCYVQKPLDKEYQSMKVYVLEGKEKDHQPIFMPNGVGGYMPGKILEPGMNRKQTDTNTVFKALQHGYVVACPAIRGRSIKYGKAPALIVDYKAAVRCLRHFKDELPGNTDYIITNGTSAGGALSSLIGATGNHKDYEPYLKQIGAYEEDDSIYAASCYCPITNLDHADKAYEWQFSHIYDYSGMHMSMDESGRTQFTHEDGVMEKRQIEASQRLDKMFPAYLNSLNLGYTLDEQGNGTFKDYIKQLIIASCNYEIEHNRMPDDLSTFIITDHAAVDVDFNAYMKRITRMKCAPAFDSLDNDSPENNEFGTDEIKCQHFADYYITNKADKQIIKMLNPMNYLEDSKVCKYWRIRHGAIDRDTSFAISAILNLKLKQSGYEVDYRLPWNTPHSGDYDLDELFDWIDTITKEAK